MSALSFLRSLDTTSIILLFWYTTLLEIPRYTIGAFLVATSSLWPPRAGAAESGLTVSVVLVGHNEAQALAACVEALAEQTIARKPGRMQLIVVDDGSTDGMADIARRLQRERKIDEMLRLNLRGGKSAGVNLGLSVCKGDIVIISDVDTTFDRDAFAMILRHFADPGIGAVSGNLGARNASATLVTRHQAIEYAIGISVGRRIADMLGMLSIVSGAFGAFRRTAVEAVGRQDVEVGEDADLTMKLRRAGWHIGFAPEARALTQVPETISALIAQRLRWDRGLITIWARKFRGALDPGSRHSVSPTCSRSAMSSAFRSSWRWRFRSTWCGSGSTSASLRQPLLPPRLPATSSWTSLHLPRPPWGVTSRSSSFFTCPSTRRCKSPSCGWSDLLPSCRSWCSAAPTATLTFRSVSCNKPR
jgi:cellulose synthase/poly-beta-1,6-N-acetylglucosamine synthase-like glycosyltransferase